MIYIFNSAYLPTYFENVYRLVGLPEGVTVDMRYTEGLNAPAISTDSEYDGSKCIICYVDRFTDDYVYYPCRKGIIRSIKRAQGRVFYNIQLAEYCHSSDPQRFTSSLQTAVSNSPRLTSENPKESNDGLYCIQGPNLDEHISTSADSWTNCVRQIYQTTPFADVIPAFYLVEITKGNKKVKCEIEGLRLHANKDYLLTIYYKYPLERLHKGKHKIIVKMGSEINRELNIGSVSDKLEIPFNLPPTNFSDSEIKIQTSAKKNDSADEIDYFSDIPFKTTAWRSNLILFGFLFLLSFLDSFIAVDFALTNSDAWGSTFFDFLKFSIVIWALFLYKGKLKIPGL